MKPLHASFKRLSRCKCCSSKHARRTKLNTGASSARGKAKLEIKKELRQS